MDFSTYNKALKEKIISYLKHHNFPYEIAELSPNKPEIGEIRDSAYFYTVLSVKCSHTGIPMKNSEGRAIVYIRIRKSAFVNYPYWEII